MPFDWGRFFRYKTHGIELKSDVGRYRTYAFYPVTAKAFPTRLCETGCYYTGFHDEVKCHACTFTYSSWNQRDIPEEKHRLHSPECPFLNGNDIVTAGFDDIQLEDRLINGFSEEANRFSLKDFIPLHERPNSGMSNEKKKEESIDNREWNAGAETMNTYLRTGTRGFCENGDAREDNDTAGADAMPFEEYSARLRSYKHWPKRQIANPQMLAKAGFYFTGGGDIIRCYKCHFEIRNLYDGIDPLEEHSRLYPYCDHLRQNKGDQRFHQNTRGRDAEQTVPKERRGREHFQKKRDEQYGILKSQSNSEGLHCNTVELTEQRGERISYEEERHEQCDTKCKICLRRESDMVFLPCRHLVCCRVCADDSSVCIFCSKTVMGKIRIYR